MRTITPTLLAAQRSASRTPCIKVEARNLLAGVVNLKWERLYSGAEADGPHALTIPADGSLVRLRITPVGDSRKLYRQRVTAPGPGSVFSQWTYLNQYNIMAAAACSLGAEVSIFWIKSNGEIDRQKSTDNGATWPTTDYPGYAPTGTGVTQAAAAYRDNGDLALFLTDTSTLYLIKRLGGIWQTRTQWNKTTGALTRVATIYDGDWKLLVSGQDTSGNYKLWSLVYGDGGELTAGTWSDLKEITSAPSDGAFQYVAVFLDKPDTYRCFFTEKFSGSEAYNRPFHSHTIPDISFLDNRWREPVPFEATSENGLAMAHTADYAWLSSPSGVWRAGWGEENLDLSEDIIAVSLKLEAGNGELKLELQNNNGKYNSPGTGDLAVLETGCQIDFSAGYRTPAGSEFSSGLSFTLGACEHISKPTGRDACATLTLFAADRWEALEKWIARNQFRWNNPVISSTEASVKEILAQVLARSGLKLTLISQSSVATGFYPDFTIHPGDNGKATVKRLLSFIPDILFLEGNTAYLINPLATDAAVYNYGPQAGTPVPLYHVILEGRYQTGKWKTNRVQVEGYGVTASSFAWTEIRKTGDILKC